MGPASTPDDGTHAHRLNDDNGTGGVPCAEARTHGIVPVHRDYSVYPYRDYRNNDGVVCE